MMADLKLEAKVFYYDNIKVGELTIEEGTTLHQRVLAAMDFFDTAYNDGYECGHSDGYDEGMSDGHSNGVTSGIKLERERVKDEHTRREAAKANRPFSTFARKANHKSRIARRRFKAS